MRSTSIQFIGTGSGKTSVKRDHSSIIIEHKGKVLLIDPGDGISKSLLKSGIDYNSIDAVLFTHFHPDHFCGFPSLISQMKIGERSKPLSIFAHNSKIAFLHQFLNNSYQFSSRLGYIIDFKPFVEDTIVEVFETFTFVAKQNSHLEKYSRYTSEEISLASSSFHFTLSEKSVFYSGDVGGVKDLFLFNSKRYDCLITEGTHIKIEEFEQLKNEIEWGELFITHIADEDEAEINALVKQISNLGNSKCSVAYDGLRIEL